MTKSQKNRIQTGKKALANTFFVAIALLLASCKQLIVQQPAVQAAGDESGTVTSEVVKDLMCQGFVLSLGVILILYLLAQGLYRLETGRWKGFWNFLEQHLTWLFVGVWILGFCTYAVGSYIPDGTTPLTTWGSWWNMIRLSPFVIVHTFEMFALQSDISTVNEPFHQNLYYMTIFSFSHLAAALVSLIFVIKHFGYNVVAGTQMWLEAHRRKHYDQLFIFWGMNDATFSLAADMKKPGRIKGSWKALIVKTADDRDKQSEKTGLDRLFNFLSLKNIELDQFKELGFLSCNAFSMLSKLETGDGAGHADDTKILAKRLRLHSVARLIGRTDRNVHIFMFGDDDKNNIKAAANLRRDQTVTEFAQQDGHHVYIYCKARHDSVSRVVEDMHSDRGMDIRIVDPAYDSINFLKMTEAYHPIRFVDIDKEENLGTVQSPFNALVVGFGWTGRDAVRFLYEYGAFVSDRSAKDDDVAQRTDSLYQQEGIDRTVVRSPFCCHIVDPDVDKIKGIFKAHSPAMFNRANQSMLDFLAMDANSDVFFDRLKDWCEGLNYVVVATGNDEQNITIAVRIFKYVSMYRKNLHHFCIFVHCHTRGEEQHLQHIADFYNEANAPKEKQHEPHIIVFGKTEQVYTYSHIVENVFEREGEEYNAEYCEVSGNKGKKDVWKSRHEFFLSQGTLENYAKLRRQECQDTSNAYHAATKTFIMQEVANERGLPYVSLCLSGERPAPAFHRTVSGKNTPVEGYLASDGNTLTGKEELLMRNIARLEHLRWNASHEVLGYSCYDEAPDCVRTALKKDVNKCNETYRLHNCLIPWQELDQASENAIDAEGDYYPDFKLFDYAVVTTTLRLHANRKKNEKMN